MSAVWGYSENIYSPGVLPPVTPSGPRSRARQAARGIPQLPPRLSRQAPAREFGANRLHGVAAIIAGIRLISEFIALPLMMISAMTVYWPAGGLPSSLIENVRS